MSNVIKLGRTNSKINFSIGNNSNFGGSDNETEDEYLRRLEEEKQEQIFNSGRDSAIKELQNNYMQSINQKFNEFDNLMYSIQEKLSEYKDAFDKIVIDSAFIVASKIIQKSVSDSPIISDTIRESIRKIIGANNIVIRLSPSDKAIIQETDMDFFDNSSYSSLKFEVDDRIDTGGCLVESEIGNVDARISSQLNELKIALLHEQISEN